MEKKSLKAIIAVALALLLGLILYNLTPSDWPPGLYHAVVRVDVNGSTIAVLVLFKAGRGAYPVYTSSSQNIGGHTYNVSVYVKPPSSLKPGSKLEVYVATYRDGKPYRLPLSSFQLRVGLPDGRMYSYYPTSVKGENIVFEVHPFEKAREAAFVFGSALVLFIASDVIHYVLTGLYLTIALALLGVIYYKVAFYRYMSTIVLVFLAGSALELAIRYNGLDRRLASLLLRIGRTPLRLIAGTAAIAAFLSMWMSNTSATYVVLPFVLALLREAGLLETPLTVVLLVSLPMATSTGGTATIIGTPPNLIAAGYINDVLFGRCVVDFVKWLAIGLPAFAVAFTTGLLLLVAYARLQGVDVRGLEARLLEARRRLLASSNGGWSRRELKALAAILFLVALWLTEPLHHINTGIAGAIGILAFFASGVLSVEKHFKELAWDLMVLFGAGLTLGVALMDSGWTHLIVSSLSSLKGMGYLALYIIALASYLIGTVISSHTAATAFLAPLIAPVGVILAPTLNVGPEVGGAIAVIVATLALNNAVALPISTPPSAIVYSTGRVRVRDLAVYGLVFGLLATLLVTTLVIILLPHIAALLA